MSGFQIPGLGHAKPDEKLPPLPSHQTLEAPQSNDTQKDTEISDAPAATSAVPEQAAVEEASKNTEVANIPTTHSMVPEQTNASVAGNEASKDIEVTDAPATNPTTAERQAETSTVATENAAPENTEQPLLSTAGNDNSDSMVIDQPESPPSLTGALEAALGGLDDDNAEQALGQLQSRPEETANPAQQQEQAAAEHPEWEADSSPYEFSSESSSSSDSSDEDSDNEGYELLGVEETARLLMEAEGGSDDEGDKAGRAPGSGQVRTKNEVPEEIIPRPDITITPEMKVEELGSVEHVVKNMILVLAFTPGEYQVLDTGSILCNADRVVIGAVAETIGKVLQPMYTVRFNSEEEIKSFGIEVGTKIFYSVDHASYVFTEPLRNLKGSDASNLHDEEVGDDEMEFSDDEKEAEYRRSIKAKKREGWKNGGNSRGRGGREPHPLRQELGPDGELNYDDEGPYKPLARPPGFGSGPVSQETEPSRSNPPHRGRGRGDFRGRGRGRGSNNRGGGGRGRQPSFQPAEGHSLPPQGAPSHQQGYQPPPPPGWNGAPPAVPNFGFQWPPQPQGNGGQLPVPPPPPPGWTGAPAPAPAQGNPQNSAFMNPALLAALMSHMQGQNGQQGQQPWGGQQGQ